MSGTITALKAQRAKDRVSVYLDGEFAFGLALIHAVWLRTGQNLTDEQIGALKEADTLEKAKRKAVDFVAYRPRTAREVRRRLQKAGVDEAAAERVLADLRSAGLIDDESFSRQWAESRLRNSPRSRRMIAWELRQKGVDAKTIDHALDAVQADDHAAALAAARRRLPRLAGEEPFARKRKLIEHLARSGFGFDVIQDAVTMALADDADTDDNGMDTQHGDIADH